ncbi:protein DETOXIFICATION 30-like isoform X2 [Solanum lycopersicum]|uniref:protein DETOXIFICATION 30-like isoform X2 n=1 Tax=Solanum lycopersicum TaxID=4081 RepID=UPI003749E93B
MEEDYHYLPCFDSEHDMQSIDGVKTFFHEFYIESKKLWFMVLAQFVYILCGTCGEAWSGFTFKAFENLWGFVRLSLASGVMICLEYWYFMALIISAGYVKDAKIAVDAVSICTSIVGWTFMLCIGFNAAISVRVSNELGAGHPRTAKFSVLVVSITSLLIGTILTIALFVARSRYPPLFTKSFEVQQVVYELTPLLGTTIMLNGLQPTLSGWQIYVAYINIVSYYAFGIPLGLILSFCLDMGVKGMWTGMLLGTTLQTSILILMISKTNWKKEASVAEERVKEWRGSK